MKATTLKRLAVLVAAFGLVAGSGFYTQRFQVDRLGRQQLAKAELAHQKDDFVAATTLLGEYLQEFPDDRETRIKYADTLLKASQSQKAKSDALTIYSNVLRRDDGRDDVRRKRVDLKIQMRLYISHPGADDGADVDLKILLGKTPNDGHIVFLMGRCYEEAAGDALAAGKAIESYRRAIQLNAPERIEATERLATLLRDRVNQPEAAERVIDKLVAESPGDFRVYLARGRDRLKLAHREPARQSLLSDARSDFENARKLAPGDPTVYLGLADIAIRGSKASYDEATRILEDGLQHAPDSEPLYLMLAEVLKRSGRVHDASKAIKLLEDGLKSRANPIGLRLSLAELLARAGDTNRLSVQIAELKKLGCPDAWLQYFTAWRHINAKELVNAREVIFGLLAVANRVSDLSFKAKVYELAARYWNDAGDREGRQNVLREALLANPHDMVAKLAWIGTLVSQGDIDSAIKEYRILARQVPEVRLVLARLLIAQIERRSKSKQDWTEVNDLVKQLLDSSPGAIEPIILDAQLKFAKGDQSAAVSSLEKSQGKFPKSVELRVARAQFLGLAGRFEEAMRLLGQAEQELGDQVDFRLARARLFASKGGPQVQKVLMDLSQKVEELSPAHRKKLLDGLAIELLRMQDLKGAIQLWTRIAEEDSTSIEVRLRLFDLALQDADTVAIDKNIMQIATIEGSEGLQARYCRLRYLIWQASRAVDKQKREVIHYEARSLLDELVSRRGDWSVIPLAQAQLVEQVLAQGDLAGVELAAKEDTVIRLYQQAIKLGQRHPFVVRHAVQLLIKKNRVGEAFELLASLPIGSDVAGWARRTLAKVIAAGPDRNQLSKAIALFEPGGEPAPKGEEGMSLTEPDDQRVLAGLLAARRNRGQLKRAIEILETLVARNLASSDDQFVLAGLYESVDDWPKTQQRYRELILGTRNLRTIEILRIRPLYLLNLAGNLLEHRKPGDEQDLAEARELAAEITRLQPDAPGTLALQVEIHRASNEIDQAAGLIQAYANRPNLDPNVFADLAKLAEKVGRVKLAEELLRRMATGPTELAGKLRLAELLGRHAQIDEALKMCEPLLGNLGDTNLVGDTCVRILFGSGERDRAADLARIDRVAGWFVQAIAQSREQQPDWWLCLALGNLREKQGRYAEAEKLYLQAAQTGDRNGISYNNLAMLKALGNEHLKEALEYADRAIGINPEQAEFLDTRAMVHLASGAVRLALLDFQEALEIKPASPSIQFHLAQAYLDNHEIAKARRCFETAKKNGFAPGCLHELEQPKLPALLQKLGAPE
jgi:tetratricopeptide (TPR) repeat protein